MRNPLPLAAAALGATLLALPARSETPASDPKAVAIADQVMQALGGKQPWDALNGLRWSFGAEVNDTVRDTTRYRSTAGASASCDERYPPQLRPD